MQLELQWFPISNKFCLSGLVSLPLTIAPQPQRAIANATFEQATSV